MPTRHEQPPANSGGLPPHPVLKDHYQSSEDRVGYVRALFDRTANRYDRINAWMSLNTGERYRQEALMRAGIHAGQSVLDCACGTGVLAAHAQRLVGPRGSVIALDPSLPMLLQAAKRGVEKRVASIAEQLPLPDASLDAVTVGYALRHVADLRIAFAEFARVLRPGGRLMILEMVPPTSPIGHFLAKLYLKHLVPALAYVATHDADSRRLMRYYWDTVDQCVAPSRVIAALEDAGFLDVRREILFGLLTEYHASAPPDHTRPGGGA